MPKRKLYFEYRIISNQIVAIRIDGLVPRI